MINEERESAMSRLVAVPINTRYDPSVRQSAFFRQRDTTIGRGNVVDPASPNLFRFEPLAAPRNEPR
jgi:hypothetical protein